MHRVGLALLPLALHLLASPLAAQFVRGRVVDSVTERPLDGAVVRLLDENGQVSAVALTDGSGTFAFEALTPRYYTMRVARAGYGYGETTRFLLGDAETEEVVFPLPPAPIVLDPLTVVAPSRNLTGFLRRRDFGVGRTLDPAYLARRQPRDAAALLQGIQGLELLPRNGVLSEVRVNARGNQCIPTIYVDGVRTQRGMGPEGALNADRATDEDAIDVTEFVRVSGVRAVEFYLDPSDSPVEFPPTAFSNCGVLIFWTEHGFRD